MASGSRTLRQRWSDAFKKRIVAEASEPGVTVTEIAGRYAHAVFVFAVRTNRTN